MLVAQLGPDALGDCLSLGLFLAFILFWMVMAMRLVHAQRRIADSMELLSENVNAALRERGPE